MRAKEAVPKVGAGCLTGQQVPSTCLRQDFRDLLFREGSGTCSQDNRAVGNSRLTHRDVLSVSCEQVPEPDPWHSLFRAHGALLHDTYFWRQEPPESW